MPYRGNRQTIPAGPGFTTIFDDEVGVSSILITCAAGSTNALEYRIDDPPDPDGEFARLEPGDAFRAESDRRPPIKRISARGVGGGATGGIEP